MIHWSFYHGHDQDIVGKKKKHDNTIYTFDIETSSIIILDGKIYPAINYKDLNEKEQKECSFYSFMYIWMFGINDTIYFGRTWKEFQIPKGIHYDNNHHRIPSYNLIYALLLYLHVPSGGVDYIHAGYVLC